MADMTPTQALAHAPASADKTAIISTLDTLIDDLETANSSGDTIGDLALAQMKSELIDWAERLGNNLSA